MLVRPSHIAGESEHGFLLRQGHMNGLHDPSWIRRPARGAHRRVQVCAECLVGTGIYWRKDWESELPVCQMHRAWLIDVCAACQRHITFASTRFLSCRCGHPLGETKPVPIADVTWQVLASQQADLDVLCWLGSLEKHGLTGKPGKRAARSSIADRADLVDRGAAIVYGWPLSFDQLLNQLRTTGEGEPVALASRAFPTLTKRMRSISDKRWRQRVEAAFVGYIMASHRSPQPLLSRHVPCSANAERVARRLEVSSNTVADLLSDDGAMVRTTKAGRRRVLIPPETEARIGARLKDEVSNSSAARTLALSVSRVRSLMQHGAIVALRVGASRQSIDKFRARLFAIARPAAQVEDANTAPLGHALRTLVPRSLTHAFFRALEQGEVALFHRASTGVAKLGVSLSVCLTQVAEWVRAQRTVQLDGGKAIDLTRAAGRLGVKPEVAKHLVLRGLLQPVVPSRPPRSKLTFLAAELSRFNEQFVLLKVLASEAGISPKCAPGWARRTGIELVCGPTVDGSRQYVAKRRPTSTSSLPKESQ